MKLIKRYLVWLLTYAYEVFAVIHLIGLLVFLAWLFIASVGCQGTLNEMSVAATDRLVARVVEEVGSKLPPAAPNGNTEELIAIIAGAVAVIGHRYWYHWRVNGKVKP